MERLLHWRVARKVYKTLEKFKPRQKCGQSLQLHLFLCKRGSDKIMDWVELQLLASRLRCFCPATLVEDDRYTVTPSAADPNIIMVGRARARIQYNSSFSQQWVYSDPRFNFTTMSRESQLIFRPWQAQLDSIRWQVPMFKTKRIWDGIKTDWMQRQRVHM